MNNDYENLLNDFVGSSIPVASETIGSKGAGFLKLRDYTANGTCYRIPAAFRKPCFCFLSLALTYNTARIESDSAGDAFVEPEPSDRYLLSVEFDDLYPQAVHRKDKKVVTALYRIGEAEPLSVVEMGPERCGQVLWDGGICPMEPGGYFILISNAEPIDEQDARFDTVGNCYRFFFRILPHGSKLEHPLLETASCSAENLLTLKMKGIVEGRDCFSVYVYNGSGRVMVQQEHFQYSLNRDGEIRLNLYSKEWWLDDRYTFVVLHNDEPFASFSQERRGGEVAGCQVCEPLEHDSYLSRLARRTKTDPYWKPLVQMGGYSEIASGVLDSFGGKAKECSVRCAIATDLPYIYGRVAPVAAVLTGNDSVDCFDCGMLLHYGEEDSGYLNDLEGRVICLYQLSSLFAAEGAGLLLEVEKKVKEDSGFHLMLYGTSDELEHLFGLSPVLAGCIPPKNRWNVRPYTLQEQINEVRKQVEDNGIVFSRNAQEMLIMLMTLKKDDIRNWGKAEISGWVGNEILPAFRRRVLDGRMWAATQYFFTTLEEEDIRLEVADYNTDVYDASLAELNGMIGLSELKKRLTSIFNRTRFEEKRRMLGFSVPEKGGYHMIFTGNPGTGKTTVARLVGRIFHSMGLLSNGEVVETERSKMVGRYIGETEQNMEELLEKAKGNVLFIDEAYSLCDNDEGDRKDYGCRALECLLTVLSRKNPDMIVILAGYEKEMDRMLELNPGMKGRFPYKFRFEDYDADELYRIACNLLSCADYVMTSEADALLKETIEDAVAHKDDFFHNARWVEQYMLDGVVSAMSDRVMAMPAKAGSRDLYQTIEIQDIREAYRMMKPKSAAEMITRRRIGFVA